MKKRVICLLLAMFFALSLTVPVMAATTEGGLIYDATDLLDMNTVQPVEDKFYQIAEEFGVELRVDVVDDLEGYEIFDYAELFYDQYEYGYGDTRDCIYLMLYVSEDTAGLALNEVQLYCGGTNADYLWEFYETADMYMGSYASPDSWAGDITADQQVFAAFMDTFASAAYGYLSGGTVALPEGEATQPPVVEEDMDDSGEFDVFLITDLAGILNDDELDALEAKAERISDTYNCSVFAITVEDYTEFGSSIESLCDEIYQNYGSDCIVLLLSMAERDYSLRDYGQLTASGITEYGFDTLEDSFLDNFGDDDWYGGLSDYLDQSEVLLKAAQEGEPLDEPAASRALKAYGISLAVGLIAAVVVCGIFKGQMKTAVKATSASSYVAPGGTNILVREDIYTHTTRTEEKIEKSSSSSSDDSNHSRSGKF